MAKKNLPERLRDHCIGHPHAKVSWPHRIFHDAAAEIERMHECLSLVLEAETLNEAKAAAIVGLPNENRPIR